MSTVITIPARLNSSRIKEKMLLQFNGRPLIQNVFESVSTFGYDTFVLTDSKKIAKHIPNSNVILTDKAENGTARIASVLDKLNYDNYLNIQGDMLGLTKNTIEPVVNHYASSSMYGVITAYKKGYNKKGVKVIHSNGQASWFTRHDIGYGDSHLGIYMYQKTVLQQYYKFKSADNNKEDLEQLRILRYFPMYVTEVPYDGQEINTESDL